MKAQKGSGDEAKPVEMHLTAQEMAVICRDARRRRGNGVYRPASARPSRLNALRQRQANNVPLSQWVDETQVLSYQELLRAIGFDLDRWKAQGFRLEEMAAASSCASRVRRAARLFSRSTRCRRKNCASASPNRSAVAAIAARSPSARLLPPPDDQARMTSHSGASDFLVRVVH